MSTNPTPPGEETGETHSQRRRSTRRRVPKIEWEESTNNRDEERDGNGGGGSDNISKVKKLSKGSSRDKRKTRSVMEGNRVSKGFSKGVRASVEGKTGFTIPPSIFNDIPDIDLCPMENTRKRHSKQGSSSPHKMRKLMKHSDGCSSNSPGSETSSTDGTESRLNDSNISQRNDIAESAIGSPEITLQNNNTPCSTCPVSDSKPTQLETRAIEQPVSSHEVLSFIDHSTSVKSWSKEDVNPNSTSPVILWAVDNIPDALNTDSSEEEWMNIIDVVLSLWNAQPHSTKLNYLDKANKNRCSKGMISYEDNGADQNAVATTNNRSMNDDVTGSTKQADNHSKINNINPSSLPPPSPSVSSSSLSRGGTMTPLHPSTQGNTPLSTVTPCQSQPIPPSNGTLFNNLPIPLLATTSLMIDQNMWQPGTTTVAVDPSSSSTAAAPLSSWSIPSGNTVVPYCFPTSLPIGLPPFTSSENSTVTVPSFGNALKLSASIPITMADHINRTSTNSSLSKSALPIVQVENPIVVCSSPLSQLDFPLPLHSIAGPFRSLPGPFLSTPFSITPFNMPGTPHYSLSQTTTHDDITTPTSILTNQASLQSSFCINSILGGATTVGTPLSVGNKPTSTTLPTISSQESSTKPVKKRKDKKLLPNSSSSKNNAMKSSFLCSTVTPSKPSNTITITATPTVVSTMSTGLSQTPSVITTEGLSCSSNSQSFTAVSEEWKRSLENQVREKNSTKSKTSRKNKVTKSSKGSSQNILFTIEVPKKAKFQKKRNMTSPMTTPIPSRLNSSLVFDQSFGCSPPHVIPPWHSSLQISSPSLSLTPISSPRYSNPLLSPCHPNPLLKGSGTPTNGVPASPSSSTPSPALFSNSPTLFTNSPALFTNSPALFTNSPTLFTNSPSLFTNSPALLTNSPALSTPSVDGNLRGMKISAEDQIKFDARNYANLERQYWNMLLVLEEQKQSIANIKERLVKARIEQQTMMLNNEKFNHMKELVVNPVLDPVVPDLLTETYKELPVTSEIKLKGTFDKPILENEDVYKYLLQSLS